MCAKYTSKHVVTNFASNDTFPSSRHIDIHSGESSQLSSVSDRESGRPPNQGSSANMLPKCLVFSTGQVHDGSQ